MHINTPTIRGDSCSFIKECAVYFIKEIRRDLFFLIDEQSLSQRAEDFYISRRGTRFVCLDPRIPHIGTRRLTTHSGIKVSSFLVRFRARIQKIRLVLIDALQRRNKTS